MSGSWEEDIKRNNSFLLYDLYGHALAHELMKFAKLCRPFLAHHYHILGSSDQCLGVERRGLHFLPQIYLHFGWEWGHEFYNFRRPFLANHYYIRGLSDLCLEVQRRFLKKKCIFIVWLIWSRPSTRTIMKFKISVDSSLGIFTTYLGISGSKEEDF